MIVNDILYNPEHSYYGRIKNIAIGFVVMSAWIMIFIPFLHWVDPPPPSSPWTVFDPPKETLIHALFFKCISAPLWEEVVFRWFPLFMVRKLSREYKIPVILASSAIFGFCHGDAVNVWIQGVLGLVMACVYLKNGYHYWSAVILHFLWNYMVIFGFHSLGSAI